MQPFTSRLPSLTALRAIEALDRLGTATEVAHELNLTQSAVSRQIQTAEDILGLKLVQRSGRTLQLTDPATEFAQAIRTALSGLTSAAMAMKLAPVGGALNLAILPSFGMRWLVPRLPDFTQRYPEVTLNMTTRLRPFAFEAESIDAALHFQGQEWPRTQSLRLMSEYVVPVCAPVLCPDGPVGLDDLLRMPLLHIQTRPDAWRDWFAQHDMETPPLPGTSFDQFTAITQAALHGLGVALIPEYLVRAELASGELVRATHAEPVSLGAYYLVWPENRPLSHPLETFRDWLATCVEGEDGLPR